MSAPVMASRTPAEVTLAEEFAATKGKLPGTAEVARLRQEAFDSFAQSGLPNRRIESWHYTDLRNLMREALPLAPAANAAALAALGKEMRAKGLPRQSLVLVDGVFAQDLSSPPKGVKVT